MSDVIETSNMSRMTMPNPCKDGEEQHISLVLLSLSDQILKKPGDAEHVQIDPAQYTQAMALAARYIGHLEKNLEMIIKLHDSRLDWVRSSLMERKSGKLLMKIRAACLKWRIIPINFKTH